MNLLNKKTKDIAYGMCWEDPKVIQKALQIKKQDVILSISSAGDNIINMLLHNPKRIYAIDLDPFANYLTDLKIQGIKHLTHEEFLSLLGVNDLKNSITNYKKLREDLNKETRSFWDKNFELIKKGIIYNGKHEQRVKIHGKFLQFLYGNKKIEKLFTFDDLRRQEKYFYSYIYKTPWSLILNLERIKNIFKIKLSYDMIVSIIKNKKKPPRSDFEFIKKLAYNKNQKKEMESIFTKIPLKSNYFASMILLGQYHSQECMPPYLKKKNFKSLKERVDRITLKTVSIKQALEEFDENSIDKFNLSNVLDWMTNEDFITCIKKIIHVGNKTARFIYFSNRVDRDIPETIKYISPDKELSKQLLKENRTMGYNDIQTGTII